MPRSIAINHVLVSRTNGSIRSPYVIDSSIEIPTSLLPPLPRGETTRHNLSLETRNGLIDTDISIVSTDATKGETENNRVTVYLKSAKGPVTAKVVCAALYLILRSAID